MPDISCILHYLWPILTVCFSSLMLKEPFSMAKFAALLLSFAGVIVVVFRPGETGTMTKEAVWGYLSCILAARFYVRIFSADGTAERPMV